MNKLLKWFLSSFDNTTNGMSARKVSAFHVMIIYTLSRTVFIFVVKDAWYLLLGSVLDTVFIMLLLGMITFEQIIKFKNGESHNKPDEPNELDNPTREVL
jgi:hypothetical protein